MKQRDIKELHTKTVEELRTMSKDLKESLAAARMDLSQQKLSNTTSLTNMRHDIARIMTVLQIEVMQETKEPVTEGSKA